MGNNKIILKTYVKLKVVCFDDLPKIKSSSFKEISIGTIPEKEEFNYTKGNDS